MKTIEEYVKNQMVKKKISQGDFCEKIGISDVALRKLYKRNDCKLSTAAKIAEVLKVDVCEIVKLNDEKNEMIGEKKLIEAMEAEISYLKHIIELKKGIISQDSINN